MENFEEIKAALKQSGFDGKLWEKGEYTRIYVGYNGKSLGYLEQDEDGNLKDNVAGKTVALRGALDKAGYVPHGSCSVFVKKPQV